MTTGQKKAGTWILRIIASVLLLQTLFFKFTAAPESVYIFSTIGIEPWGRIGSGIAELITAILLLIPSTTGFGALMGIGLMCGALFFHLTTIGIVVMNDNGQLFIYALLVLISCVILAWTYRYKMLRSLGLFKSTLTHH